MLHDVLCKILLFLAPPEWRGVKKKSRELYAGVLVCVPSILIEYILLPHISLG
jgi:hypothetical protein